jgi:archaellum biogenesis protein FlaJ (TadC family)
MRRSTLTQTPKEHQMTDCQTQFMQWVVITLAISAAIVLVLIMSHPTWLR